MAQLTLSGEEIKPREPFTRMTKNQRKIWNLLNSMQRGMTHDHIRTVLASSKIITFDNRLRELKASGWVETWEGPDGILRYYAVKPEAGK